MLLKAIRMWGSVDRHSFCMAQGTSVGQWSREHLISSERHSQHYPSDIVIDILWWVLELFRLAGWGRILNQLMTKLTGNLREAYLHDMYWLCTNPLHPFDISSKNISLDSLCFNQDKAQLQQTIWHPLF
jgi:hypothetical protein